MHQAIACALVATPVLAYITYARHDGDSTIARHLDEPWWA